jgi:hypothetical protein
MYLRLSAKISVPINLKEAEYGWGKEEGSSEGRVVDLRRKTPACQQSVQQLRRGFLPEKTGCPLFLLPIQQL